MSSEYWYESKPYPEPEPERVSMSSETPRILPPVLPNNEGPILEERYLQHCAAIGHITANSLTIDIDWRIKKYLSAVGLQ